MSSAPARSRRRGAAVFWLPFAIFAALGVLWSLASPVFSVPDENAHAPDEKLDLGNFHGGIVSAAHLYAEIGNMQPS